MLFHSGCCVDLDLLSGTRTCHFWDVFALAVASTLLKLTLFMLQVVNILSNLHVIFLGCYDVIKINGVNIGHRGDEPYHH